MKPHPISVFKRPELKTSKQLSINEQRAAELYPDTRKEHKLLSRVPFSEFFAENQREK